MSKKIVLYVVFAKKDNIKHVGRLATAITEDIISETKQLLIKRFEKESKEKYKLNYCHIGCMFII